MKRKELGWWKLRKAGLMCIILISFLSLLLVLVKNRKESSLSERFWKFPQLSFVRLVHC